MTEKAALLQVDLPPYPAKGSAPRESEDPRPKVRWRRAIHARVLSAKMDKGFEIVRDEPIAVEATDVLIPSQFGAFDVDNLLKDIFDALQGRLADESGGKRSHKAAIVNDQQIVRVSVEKLLTKSKANRGGVLLLKRLARTIDEQALPE
jgi:hypothetical protein